MYSFMNKMDNNIVIFSYLAHGRTRDALSSPYFTRAELPKSSTIYRVGENVSYNVEVDSHTT